MGGLSGLCQVKLTSAGVIKSHECQEAGAYRKSFHRVGTLEVWRHYLQLNEFYRQTLCFVRDQWQVTATAAEQRRTRMQLFSAALKRVILQRVRPEGRGGTGCLQRESGPMLRYKWVTLCIELWPKHSGKQQWVEAAPGLISHLGADLSNAIFI